MWQGHEQETRWLRALEGASSAVTWSIVRKVSSVESSSWVQLVVPPWQRVI
jgi:hypothetical protein